MKRTLYTTAIASAMLFVTSCGSDENGDENVSEVHATDDIEKTDDQDIDTEFESNEVDYVLPSPLQVAQLFEKAGLDYNAELPLDPSMASNYTTQAKKEAIFGVYSADLAYAVMNDQQQAAIDYMQVVKQVASETGMGIVFEGESLVTRFETNIGNQDSIIPLLIDIQDRTAILMEENEESHLIVIHFAGAWLEGMYLGAKASLMSDNQKLGVVIGEQMVILDNLIKGLNAQPEKNPTVEFFIEKFEAMHQMFNNFESVKNMQDAEYHDPSLTDEELKQLDEMIIATREELVTP